MSGSDDAWVSIAAMAAGESPILRPEQRRYLDRLLPPRDPLMAEMEAVGAERGIPISVPEVGRLLAVLARARGARRILEIGTAIGYGTLAMARAAVEARIVSLDRDPAMLDEARGYLERAGVLDRVELRQGEALALIETLEPPFDMVYLDADKREYRRCLDRVLPRMAVGGLLVVDNLLWRGWVADPPEDAPDDDPADDIAAFNGYLMMHPQLEAVVLPIGDGVGLATKTRPLVTELGGPY